MIRRAVVSYCGAGGSTKGLHDAGYDSIGFDWWWPACRTHAAAGFPTVRADLDVWPWRPMPGLDLLWASPPCQDWSTAGRRAGAGGDRNGWPATLESVRVLRPRVFIAENVAGLANRRNRPYLDGFILAGLRRLGYDVDARVLVASDYGLPQARPRLIIIGRLDAAPVWPAGTHAAYPPKHHRMDKQGILQPELFGEPWVPAAVVFGDGIIIDRRMGNAPTTTTTTTTPSPTLTGSSFGKGQWMMVRPATTVTGDPRISEPGHHDPTVGNSQHTDARWTIEAAAALQGFPPDWPWQGNKTAVHKQIGNAVPPILAQRLAEANGGT